MAIHRPNDHFEFLSNPEFLAAGTAVNDLLYPDRVLIGSLPSRSGRRAAQALADIYAAWIPRQRILTTNVWSSELSKLVANSMLAQRISSINSIAAICERTGADVDEVAASIGCDPRIGAKFLKAGIGFGGSCFKKDILSLVYLAESLGLDEVAEYWLQVVKMNELARDRFTARVIRCLNNTLVGKKVAVLGYAFKPNTNDTRESPALGIIKTLLDEGARHVAVFDPCCNPLVMRHEIKQLLGAMSALTEDGGPVEVYADPYEACANSDAVLITTDFDSFTNRQPQTPMAAPSPKALPQDPRPIERLYPTELELLALFRSLAVSEGSSDPLKRFNSEPPCAKDCPDCALQRGVVKSQHETSGTDLGTKSQEKLDWARIAYHMRKPRWIFDGRSVLDPAAMEKLGVRLEAVGRQGRIS